MAHYQYQYQGMLIDQYGGPSNDMIRIIDSIFFYLDSVFEPRQSGYMQGKKLFEFFKHVGTPEDRNPGRLDAAILERYYEFLAIPFEKGPSGEPVLGRHSFVTLMCLQVRRDPNLGHHQLNQAISLFQLRDPMPPHNLWPLIPRQFLPVSPDTSVVARFDEMRAMYAQFKNQQMQLGMMRLQMHREVANVAVQGARNVQSASLGPGWTYRNR